MNFSLQEYHTIDFGGWLWTGLVYFEEFAPEIGEFGYFLGSLFKFLF